MIAGAHWDSNKQTAVWLDATVFSPDNTKAQEQLRAKYPDFWPFIDKDECHRFIQRSSNPLILIVSGALGAKLVPEIHQSDQVSSIYVYCGNVAAHKQWADDYKDKVK
ncbi:unnamed protein product [Rotaria sp. Silwood1]|nr:unnamed protein product [Rotaria sp. Silwood1]